MELSMIMHLVELLMYVILGGLVIWFKTNAKLNNVVNGLIDKAEEEYVGFGRGNEKFQAVAGWLYELIPAPMKPFFPKTFVEQLIQNAFEQSSAYAKKQLDKFVDKALGKEVKE